MNKRWGLWIAVSTQGQAREELASLPQQEADLRSIAAKYDGDVTDVMIVPGFSRRYLSWEKFAQAALKGKQAIDAPTRMLNHWAARDLDVLAFWDGSRFGRSQSLFARFVEEAIEAGMILYSFKDGWITESNHRMFTAMGGYASAGEIDKFVERSKDGKAKNIERGLSIGRTFFSHVQQRDRMGKQEKLVLNDHYRRFWLDLAELLLTQPRLSWGEIADELNARGHRRPTGKLWIGGLVQDACEHPMTWGNMLMRGPQSLGNSAFVGAWYADPSAPLPQGAVMKYHIIDPVWSDELGKQILAELLFRRSIGPRKSPVGKYKFTGLLCCARCGYSLVVHAEPNYTGWHCSTASLVGTRQAHHRATTCDNRTYIGDRRVQAWFAEKIELARTKGLAALAAPVSTDPLLAARLSGLDGEIKQLHDQMARWIDELASDLTERVRGNIRARLNEADERMAVLEAQRVELTQRLDDTEDRAARQRSLDIILDSPDFWDWSPSEINRRLRELLGPWRLMVDGAHIISIDKPRHSGR